MIRFVPEVDGIARRLAAGAGVLWDHLSDYPGYGRNFWRDEARAIIAAISPHATFIEAGDDRKQRRGQQEGFSRDG